MIIGDNREQVVENIRVALSEENFYKKVELSDPVLSNEKAGEICKNYLYEKKMPFYKIKSFAARRIAGFFTRKINRDTEVVGAQIAKDLKSGFIVTSNHFSPIENTCVRYGLWSIGKKRLNIVSQVTNFAMDGIIGFLMNYGDTIPLHKEHRYLSRDFVSEIKKALDKKEAVLIYPEEEMWFNYRKPRPPRTGAYYFASKLNVPILSMFVEMVDTDEMERENFCRVKYRVHIVKVIYPDPKKSARENCEMMCEEDYKAKKEAYEKAYGKNLSYEFDYSDIGGFVGKNK